MRGTDDGGICGINVTVMIGQKFSDVEGNRQDEGPIPTGLCVKEEEW